MTTVYGISAHLIEDDGQHCRTGSSLGHYFRGLQGQDMAGIDDIGGQVLPQGEDEPRVNNMRQPRDGTFYHYGLATLAESAAAIEPTKGGNAMCEIFGNYGWSEGVRLEKYLPTISWSGASTTLCPTPSRARHSRTLTARPTSTPTATTLSTGTSAS